MWGVKAASSGAVATRWARPAALAALQEAGGWVGGTSSSDDGEPPASVSAQTGEKTSLDA